MPRVKTPDGQVIEITMEELQGMLPQQQNIGQSFWKGLTDAPSNLISSLGGIKPLFGIGSNLVAGDREEGLRGVADVAGGIAGGGYGAMAGGALGALGGPFAPVTVPLGAALGGAIGGTAGSLGTDYLVQAIRGKETPTLNDAAYALGGAAPYAAGGATLGLMNAKGAGRWADTLEQKAIGARSTDFLKSIKQRGMSESGEVALQEAIKEVGKTGVYKQNAGDPVGLYQAIKGQMDDLGAKMGPEVARLEDIRKALGAKVSPDWKSTMSTAEGMRGTGKLDAIETEILNRILNVEKEIDLNTVTGLDTARQNLNASVYGQGDPTYVHGISNALRQDVRGAQLRAALQLDPESPLPELLKQYAYRADIKDKVLGRAVANDASFVPSWEKGFATTGGIGSGLIASSVSGNPWWLGGALTSKLLRTPTGMLFLADVLRGNAGVGLPETVRRGFVPMQQYDQFGE